jgi:uncharacterized protein YraI
MAALAVLLLSGGAASAAVATTSLNIRDEPGLGGQVIGVIPAGQSVATSGCEQGWCRVSYNGIVGFSSASYLSGDDAAAVRPGAVIVQPQDSFAYEAAPFDAYDAAPFDAYGYDTRSLDGYAYGQPRIGFGFSFGDPRWRW